MCPIGHYCPLGSAFPTPCPDGTYSNSTGTQRYLFKWDLIPGKRFKGKVKIFHLLPLLYKGADVCDDCPSGTYCLSGEGVQSCPAGHYCLGGGVEGILPCPPGTYSPQLGLSQVEQCLICPAGESIASQFSLSLLKRINILLRRCAAEMSFHLLNCNLFTVWV